MSYIISKTNPFVNTKLTEKGRMKLAKGQLNFKYWSVGDSEINYGFEEIRDANPDDTILNGKSILFKPKDNQANIKYFISTNGEASPMNNLLDADIKVIKALINNRAEERGFYDINGPLTVAPYVVSTGTVTNTLFDGGNTITLPSTVSVNNLILFRLNNGTLHWYKVESKVGDVCTLDRNLPTSVTEAAVEFIEYASGNIYENGMANNSVTPYWNVNTLSFDDSLDIPIEHVQFWNMNNIWSQNIIGLNTSTAEEFYKYGSNDMIGFRSPFLCYIDTISPSDTQLADVCVDASQTSNGATLDADNRAISVIHYTNNDISNLYGEFLYVDATGKGVEIEIPDMMYHRRIGGTANVTQVGMIFKTDGSQLHTIKNSGIEFYNLIEHPDMVDGTPKVVGKVLPYYHTIIFDNEEIVAALSYKSGRNWTLPELKLNLANSASGSTEGLLAQGETIYVTYVLENSGNGLPYSLPCQKYAKIKNTNTGTKDVSFAIHNIDELPYMRKAEGYSGVGFSAKNFKALYQIVQGDEKPKSDAWLEYTVPTTTTLNGNLTETIIPIELEKHEFKLTKIINSTATTYVINDKLNVANNVEPNRLQFGDERFFYGNVRADIGATVYKTVFDIKVSANEFNHTTNPTRTIDETLGAPEIRVSEVGIYDNEKNLVFMGKLSEPIKLINGNTVTIELSMDF